jgi:hypothetical protein
MKQKSALSRAAIALALLCLTASCGGSASKEKLGPVQEDMTTAIGVNGFLWRATLDTLSFLPMAQIDSAGGVIISDWYVNPDMPTERLKLNVFMLDKGLRSDALKVAVFRQELIDGVWSSAEVRAGTALQIEDSILTRARELRIRSLKDD